MMPAGAFQGRFGREGHPIGAEPGPAPAQLAPVPPPCAQPPGAGRLPVPAFVWDRTLKGQRRGFSGRGEGSMTAREDG